MTGEVLGRIGGRRLAARGNQGSAGADGATAPAGADGASAMRRRPRAGGGGAEPVPLKGGLGERPGLAEAVVGRLVEPGVERGRPSACPTPSPRPRGRPRSRRCSGLLEPR